MSMEVIATDAVTVAPTSGLPGLGLLGLTLRARRKEKGA